MLAKEPGVNHRDQLFSAVLDPNNKQGSGDQILQSLNRDQQLAW